MKKFVVEEKFWELFPNAKIGVIVCNDINNTIKDKDNYQEMIINAQKEAMKHLKEEEFSNNMVIKVWRDAFKNFKTKKGARSSIEALLKRTANKNELGTINPLVDIYNCISLKYALPCGGEDINKFEGDLKLTRAIGDEEFITFGAEGNIPPNEGEVVYKDDKGVICRCWNWREAIRTMLTEDTKNAFLCLELVDENRLEEFEEALSSLAELVNEHLGGEYKIQILDNNNREVVIG